MLVILFLDFDGVLHHRFDVERTDEQLALFYCLPRLERVLRDFPQVKVVISSTWRLAKSLEELRAYFSEDLRERVIDTIGSDQSDLGPFRGAREVLCKKWMRANGREGESWIALDDHAPHFNFDETTLVHCEDGFGEREEQQLRALLLRKDWDERLAVLNTPEGAQRLRDVMDRPVSLEGKLKAGEEP